MMFGRADIQGIKKVLQYVDIVGLVLFLTLFALGVPAERQGTINFKVPYSLSASYINPQFL